MCSQTPGWAVSEKLILLGNNLVGIVRTIAIMLLGINFNCHRLGKNDRKHCSCLERQQ